MNEVSLENAKKTFFVALGIDMTVTVVSMVSDFWVIDAIKNIADSGSTASESIIGNIELWGKFSALMLLTTCWVGWTLTRWIGACYAYAKEVQRTTGFRHEKWITSGWIVPFLNLFKPYQVLSEIYRAGASGYAQSDDWKKEPGSGWLLTWWIFWSITHLVMMAALKATIRKPAPDSPTLNQIIGSYNDAILFCAVSLLIAGLWFLVAGNLTKRLVERSDRPFKQVATANIVAHVAPASNDAYAEALAEIEEGRLDKGIWARSFAESGGDESKAKALYIKARASAIEADAAWVDTRPPEQENDGVASRVKSSQEKQQALDAGLSIHDVEYLGRPIMAIHYLCKYKMSEDRLAIACLEQKIRWNKHDDILWVADEEIKADTWY